MRAARALVALPVAAVLLSACSAGPADARRDAVAALTDAANDGDASGVRTQAEALMSLLEEQVAQSQVAGDEAQRLRALAEAVRSSADVIDEDLLERRRAEQAAEEARRELAETQKKLEEERRKAEEAAREAAERDRDGKGKGKGNDDDKDDD